MSTYTKENNILPLDYDAFIIPIFPSLGMYISIYIYHAPYSILEKYKSKTTYVILFQLP
jgi:hypothetical protein